jgi:hypothetical protein
MVDTVFNYTFLKTKERPGNGKFPLKMWNQERAVFLTPHSFKPQMDYYT